MGRSEQVALCISAFCVPHTCGLTPAQAQARTTCIRVASNKDQLRFFQALPSAVSLVTKPNQADAMNLRFAANGEETGISPWSFTCLRHRPVMKMKLTSPLHTPLRSVSRGGARGAALWQALVAGTYRPRAFLCLGPHPGPNVLL
jgi:hypothetical protein